MKIILTGSLGHISKPLTQGLVQQGHAVTVISSNYERQKDIEALGASAAIGSLEDVNFLIQTFKDSDAVYCMIPPNYFADASLDPNDFYRNIGNNYAQAIQQSGVNRVVHLSSIGAHLDKGTGFIVGHNTVENLLKELPGVAITHMRPVSLYYNLLNFIPVIKNAGMIISNYGTQDKIAWASPIDVAAAVAEEIVTPMTGRKIKYVASDELTCNEVASVLGEAIGKPELKWEIISDEQMLNSLIKAGIPPKAATGLVEMNASIHRGELYQDYYLNKPPITGKIKLKDFAKEFAAAYNPNKG
jgi:uncharacterized protein YbjT (DUF2867 family)